LSEINYNSKDLLIACGAFEIKARTAAEDILEAMSLDLGQETGNQEPVEGRSVEAKVFIVRKFVDITG
jgi:hypothetical protein